MQIIYTSSVRFLILFFSKFGAFAGGHSFFRLVFWGICGFLTTPLTVGPFLRLSLATGWDHFCEGHDMLPPITSPTHLAFSPILYSMVGTLVNRYILCHASQMTDPYCQIIPKPCPHSSSGLSLPHFGAVYMQSSVVTCRSG